MILRHIKLDNRIYSYTIIYSYTVKCKFNFDLYWIIRIDHLLEIYRKIFGIEVIYYIFLYYTFLPIHSSLTCKRHMRGENVLGTNRINLPGTSLECRIRTSPKRHFRTSFGRQIGTSPGRKFGTSPGRSNRIFRGRPGEVGGGRPGDQYLPAGLLPN